MREALRRALWLVPTLVVLSVLSFWAVARGTPASPGEEGVPILFNASPSRIQSLAWNAALAAAAGGPEAQHAEQLLARLGGAALPHLLPKLDALSPLERRRVARSLLPVARRMRIAEVEEINGDEDAERFWVQFWQDHVVDFKPTVTRRVVQRFGMRATALRQKELLRLDTYALDELVLQMAAAKDGAVVRRLAAAAAHIAETPWTVPDNASPEQVAASVERWQAWWARHRAKYVAPQGLERLTAPLLQTRYVLWLREAARTRFGVTKSGRPALSVLYEGMPLTLSLLLLALVGGSALGMLLGAIAITSKSPHMRRAGRSLALLWLGIPTALLVGAVPSGSADGRILSGAFVVLALGAAMALVHVGLTPEIDENGAAQTRLYRVWRTARSSARFTLRSMAASASTLLGGVFLVEYGLDLTSWGKELARALVERDLNALMLIVIATAAIQGLVHVAAAIAQRLLEIGQKPKEATPHG
jgi:peptide/nickel transport system permease protein